MAIQFVPILCLTIAFASCATNKDHHPQVYETVEEKPLETENVPRPSRESKPIDDFFKPPNFDYQTVAQQDKQKWRYTQQQQADVMNHALRHERLRKTAEAENQYFRESGQRFNDYAGRHHPYDNRNSQYFKTKKQYTRKITNRSESSQDGPGKLRDLKRTNKSLKPENYFQKSAVDLDASGTENHESNTTGYQITEAKANKRQDHVSLQTRFVGQPTSLYINGNGNLVRSEQEIAALNSLLGQHPNVQLQGLNQLLRNPNQRPIQPYQGQNDHKPIAEIQRDVPNNQNKPNIRIESKPEQLRPELQRSQGQQYLPSQSHHIQTRPEVLQIQTPPPPSPARHFQPPPHLIAYATPQAAHPIVSQNIDISQIQSQLDAASRHQIQNTLAQAQQEANRQVEAQHQAIHAARAQAEAQAIAEAQRQAFQHVQAQAQAQAHAEAQQQTRIRAKAQADAQAQALAHAKVLSTNQAKALNQAQTQADIQDQVQAQAFAQAAHAHAQAQAQVQAQAQFEAQSLAQAQAQAQAEIRKSQQQAEWTLAQLSKNTPNVQIQNSIDLTNNRPFSAPSGFAQPQAGRILKPKELAIPSQFFRQQSANAIISPNSKPQQTQSDNAEVQKYFLREESPANIQGGEGDDLQYASKYAFGYRIRDLESGNDFGHEETRDGDVAKGQYHVLLPDGRLQKVEYFTDPTGYHAKVTYENVAT